MNEHENEGVCIELCKTLKNGISLGKKPLFMFGAYGTPYRINEYEIAKAAIYFSKTEYSGTRLNMETASGKQSLSRPMQALFFSDLVRNDAAWEAFCKIFWVEWNKQKIDTEVFKNIYESAIELLVANNAYIFTTNFDAAIQAYFDLHEKIYRIMALSSRRQILNLPLAEQTPWILNLRGDVYHAVCMNRLCGGYLCESVIQPRRPNPDNKDNDDILKCPTCGKKRKMTITFPGQEEKETSISGVMDAFWKVAGNSISLICCVGFSGNSDREIVAWLSRYAEASKCPWYKLTIDTDPCNDAVDEAIKRLYPPETAYVIKSGSETLSGILKSENKG